MNTYEKIYISAGKFCANVVAGLMPTASMRRSVRQRLNPLNPERGVRYIARHYVRPLSSQGTTRHPSSFARQPIWQCWLQGEDNAPQLVRNCLASVGRNLREDQERHIITADNFADYVELPDYIVKKWRDGIISNTHFSDILRIHLLQRHGGYWIDATCLLTAPIPHWMEEQETFLFHSAGEFSYTLIQNCFIYSRPDSYIIRRWCQVVDKYWEQEDKLISYFTHHLAFRALIASDPEFRQHYEKMHVESEKPMHLLLAPLTSGHPYDEQLLREAADACFVQKLTYKINADVLADEQSLAHYFFQPSLYS